MNGRCYQCLPAVSDQPAFSDLVQVHGLTSLRAHDTEFSYVGPGGRSNIDFLFMRKPQTDRTSFDARCVPQFPLLAHREHPDHRPLMCSIPLGWKVWLHTEKQGHSKFANCSSRVLAQECHDQTVNWQCLVPQSQIVISQAKTRVAPLWPPSGNISMRPGTRIVLPP